VPKLLIKFLRFALRYLPPGFHDIAESLAQEASGKGYLATIDEETNLFIDLLSRQENHIAGGEKLTVLDIGGNLGDWTASLINKMPESRVIVIEPNPRLVKKLVERFRFSKNVDIEPCAIANQVGMLPFYADTEESAMGSLQYRNIQHLGIFFEPIANVRVTTLDNLTSGMSGEFALKIDVEGLELQVLQGAKETLRRVSLIQFEFGGTNIDSRVFFKDIYNLLDPDFRLLRLCPNGRIRRIESYSESDECFKFTTYYAARINI
jgi:FkbM family methyltransferase